MRTPPSVTPEKSDTSSFATSTSVPTTCFARASNSALNSGVFSLPTTW